MKKSIFVLGSLIIFCCFGCRAVVRKIYGFKKPTPQSHDQIIHFQNEIGFGSVPYIGLKAESWLILTNIRPPDLFVFNRQGKYIPYRDSLRPNCNGPAEQFLAELNPDKQYYYSDEYTLDTFLPFFEDSICHAVLFQKNDNSDFYIFMSYAIFAGKKLMNEKSGEWLKELRNNKQIKYQLTMLNLDVKTCWTEEQKKLLMGVR